MHVDQVVLGANLTSLLLCGTARWAHQNDPLRTSGGFRNLQLEHASDLLEDLSFVLHTVELGDETLADIANRCHVNVIFTDGSLSETADHRLILVLYKGILAGETCPDFLFRKSIRLLQKDELVRDNAHFH